MKTISSYSFKYIGRKQLVYPIVSKPNVKHTINQLLFYTVPMTKAKRKKTELANVLVSFTCPTYAQQVLSDIRDKMDDHTYEVAEYELGNLIDQTTKLNMPLIAIINSFCLLQQPDPVPPLFEPVPDSRQNETEKEIDRDTFELYYHYKPLESTSFVPFR